MDSIQEQMIRYHRNQTVKYLNSIYNTKSLFEIIVKERDEQIHSRMLKWLFELDDLPCSWRDYPIMNLLYRILERADDQKIDVDKNLKANILSGQAKISVNEVRLEIASDGVKVNNQSGLIDLLFDCNIETKGGKQSKLTICVENKVDSDEHDYQTWKYYAYLAGAQEAKNILNDNNRKEIKIEGESSYKKEPDEKQLFVLLTPHPESEMNKWHCSCPAYIHINYQDLMDFVLPEILKLNNLNPRIQFIINEYINTLSIPYIINNNKKPIMAMNKDHSELLTKFWKENSPLILAALNAFKEDENQELDERNVVQEALEILNRPTASFVVDINGNKHSNIRMWEVANLICGHLLNNGYIITQINTQLKVRGIPKLIITKNEFNQKIAKDAKNKYRWKILKDSNYYVSSQWTWNKTKNTSNPNFPEFMEKVKKMNLNITIETVK